MVILVARYVQESSDLLSPPPHLHYSICPSCGFNHCSLSDQWFLLCHRRETSKLLATRLEMEASLAASQDEAPQPQPPQKSGLATTPPAPGVLSDPEGNRNNLLPSASSVSLCDAVSVTTQPSVVTLRGNESSTNLLGSSAPFARGTSLASKPSWVSLGQPSGPPSGTEPRRTISVKPSLASLPESPDAPTGSRLSPVQSAATVPRTVPVTAVKATASTAVPLAPAHDPGKWQSKIKALKKSLGDFLVWSCYQ